MPNLESWLIPFIVALLVSVIVPQMLAMFTAVWKQRTRQLRRRRKLVSKFVISFAATSREGTDGTPYFEARENLLAHLGLKDDVIRKSIEEFCLGPTSEEIPAILGTWAAGHGWTARRAAKSRLDRGAAKEAAWTAEREAREAAGPAPATAPAPQTR